MPDLQTSQVIGLCPSSKDWKILISKIRTKYYIVTEILHRIGSNQMPVVADPKPFEVKEDDGAADTKFKIM